MIVDNATIKKDSIASTLLTNQTLNLFGIGSALIGLQVGWGNTAPDRHLSCAAVYIQVTWTCQLFQH